MKKLDLEQGSPEWHLWRKSIITATDAAVIMGISSYTTPFKLWQRKLSLVPEQATNARMERGQLLEPLARNQFILDFGIEMIPCCVESTQYNFLGASLDGLSPCGRYILEVKCNGEKIHALVKEGIIPEEHKVQVQDQLLVTKAEKCFYYSFDGENGICIEIFPDFEMHIKIISLARDFMKNIAYFESPALMDKDYKNMNQDSLWNETAALYKELDAHIKLLEDKKDEARRKLIQLCNMQNCEGSGLKVLQVITKGRVDYESIVELKEIDLNKYRKNPTNSWKITISK